MLWLDPRLILYLSIRIIVYLLKLKSSYLLTCSRRNFTISLLIIGLRFNLKCLRPSLSISRAVVVREIVGLAVI